MSERFEQALVWAAQLHSGQLRKGRPVPYVAHLLAVAALVLEAGGDEDEAIAGLLHDAVEDQGGPSVRAEIEERFGARVAAIVDACTDTDEEPKPPWRRRKEAFLEQLATASRSVRLVVAADKLHNALATIADVQSEGPEVWRRFRGGRDGTLWYYRSVAEKLGGGRLVSQLRIAVEQLERLP